MTESELELVKLLCLPHKLICEKLGISYGALKTRVKRVMDKYGVENQRALIVKVLVMDWLHITDFEYREFADE